MMLYRRRTTGSAMTRNCPADRVVSTTPATVSSTARPSPTASGTTSHDGGAACPQPNQTKAKNPSTTTVTPRSRPAGKKLVRSSVTVALRLLTPVGGPHVDVHVRNPARSE